MTSPADFQAVLDVLEFDLPCRTNEKETISADQWVLASGLQKAIRRGDVGKAAGFAKSLWTADRRMFWRRLHVAALEDIGAADPDTVIKVLVAYASPDWRHAQGDKAVAVHLAQLLAKSTKSRLADEILMYVEVAPDLAGWRRRLAKASPKLLERNALDTKLPFTVRAIALQLLAGTRQYPSRLLPKKAGSLGIAADVLRKLDIPYLFTEACIAVMGKTQWPLALFALLAQQLFHADTALQVAEHDLPATPEFEGVPIYACDGMYTRLGKGAVHRLRQEIDELGAYTPAQIGQAAFFLEGGLLNRTLTSPALDEFRRRSMTATMEASGVTADRHLQLAEILRQHWKVYDDIRLRMLEYSLYGLQLRLFPSGGA